MEIFLLVGFIVGTLLIIFGHEGARLVSNGGVLFSTKLNVVVWGEGRKYGYPCVKGELLTRHRCWLWPLFKKQQTVFFERVGAYDPTLSLADGELPAFQKEIERQLVDYHEAKDKEQERMDRLESRKAIVATVSKIKRNV